MLINLKQFLQDLFEKYDFKWEVEAHTNKFNHTTFVWLHFRSNEHKVSFSYNEFMADNTRGLRVHVSNTPNIESEVDTISKKYIEFVDYMFPTNYLEEELPLDIIKDNLSFLGPTLKSIEIELITQGAERIKIDFIDKLYFYVTGEDINANFKAKMKERRMPSLVNKHLSDMLDSLLSRAKVLQPAIYKNETSITYNWDTLLINKISDSKVDIHYKIISDSQDSLTETIYIKYALPLTDAQKEEVNKLFEKWGQEEIHN